MDSNVNSAQGPELPERLKRLSELANDLWWTWNPRAREVFRKLDYTAVAADRAQPGADAAAGVRRRCWRSPRRTSGSWRSTTRRSTRSTRRAAPATPGGTSSIPDNPGPIAYFSAEFALHQSLPIYAGGLGVLAGDHCKEASDLGIPLIGVGFMYPQGYFHQIGLAGRLAAGNLRAPQLGRRSGRAGHAPRRQALHRRRAARQPQRAGVGVAGAARAREAVPARHRSRGERAVGPRAVGAALRRRPRDPHPAGDHPRHRRRPRAEGARTAAGGLAPQRRPRRVRRAAAHSRPDRTGPVVRSGARRRAPDDDVHDAHAGAGGPRRVPVQPGRDPSRRRVGHARHLSRCSSWRSGTTTTAAGRCST